MIPKGAHLLKIVLAALLLCGVAGGVYAQNLIQDPGAETDPRWNGWTVVSGNWQMSIQIPPKEGLKHFFAGDVNISAELMQDVDVSANASNIDGGLATYTFSGWMSIFSFNNDAGRMIVEYRDASSTILSTYNTGINTSIKTWTEYTDVRLAPAGTRTIRIRLLSIYKTGTSSDGYMDDLSLTVSNATITPIELLSFDARLIQDSVAIYWATATERNNAYFTIEKSLNGESWSAVDTIAGAGNSSAVLHYIRYDDQLVQGTSYYRLKQTDLDGAYTYSKIDAVHDEGTEILLYPVPAAGNLYVSVQSDAVTDISFSCINASGQAVALEFDQQGNTYVFNISVLSSGIYFLQVQSDAERVVKKFVVE